MSELKVWWGMRFLYTFTVSPYKILITNKEEKSNFTVEQLARQHLQWSKWTWQCDKQIVHNLTGTLWRPWMPKMHNLNLITRKQIKSALRKFYKITSCNVCVKVMKVKERLRKCSRMTPEEIWVRQQWFWTASLSFKGHYSDVRQNMNRI